jgi:hypothetical protein
MSDFSPEQDELASAYLDDAATVEERARVEADPTLLARVEAFRSVRDALGAPVVAPTTAERDAAIHAALGLSNVVDLAGARRQRRLRIASIAAAILLVAGVAGALLRSAGSQNETTFRAVAGTSGSPAGGATAERAPQPATNAAGAAEFAATSRPALGSFADRSSLAAAAQSQVHGSRSGLDQSKQADSAADAGPAATTTPACLVPPPRDATGQFYGATAVLEGRQVQVDVFTLADGSLMLVVTDTASCTQVFTQPV